MCHLWPLSQLSFFSKKTADVQAILFKVCYLGRLFHLVVNQEFSKAAVFISSQPSFPICLQGNSARESVMKAEPLCPLHDWNKNG